MVQFGRGTQVGKIAEVRENIDDNLENLSESELENSLENYFEDDSQLMRILAIRDRKFKKQAFNLTNKSNRKFNNFQKFKKSFSASKTTQNNSQLKKKQKSDSGSHENPEICFKCHNLNKQAPIHFRHNCPKSNIQQVSENNSHLPVANPAVAQPVAQVQAQINQIEELPPHLELRANQINSVIENDRYSHVRMVRENKGQKYSPSLIAKAKNNKT